jgi:lactose/L-arabinose transport system substrate-binding protein
MLHSTGNAMFDAQGRVYLNNNAVMRRAMELVSQGIRDGIIMNVSDWNAYIATIQTGTVAGTLNGAWIIGSVASGQSSVGNWRLVSTPRMSNVTGATNYSTNGGSGWLVMANSRNPDLAFDFLAKTFGGSVEFYGNILHASGAIGTWGPATSAPAYSEPHPFFGGQRVFVDLVNFANNVPSFITGAFFYEARDAFARNLNDIVGGRMTVQAALDAAQREVEFIIASQ